MKIFPIKFMSKLDVLKNLYYSAAQKPIKSVSEQDSVIIDNTVKTLKKGRSICDKLSE